MTGSKNATVVGACAGDCGKGKIIDWLASHGDFDYVTRYEGGANAGHTVQVGNQKIIGHLIPCGVAAGKIGVIGRGVRVSIPDLLKEIADLKALGLTSQLLIDAGAQLVFSWHKIIEWWVESNKDKAGHKTYSTMRGICGVAASKDLRLNPQVGLICYPEELRAALIDFYEVFKPIFCAPAVLEKFGKIQSVELVADELLSYRQALAPFVCDTRQVLYDAWLNQRGILNEGAHGLMLDPDWGTYGFNTAGLCTFAGLAYASGLPLEAIGRRIGVCKAIASRVGNGPFPSELGDARLLETESKPSAESRQSFLEELRYKINAGQATPYETGQYFRVLAGEYGSTTGRPRRCGWFDLAWLKYFVAVNEPDELAITKLDCLSGLRTLKMLVYYRLNSSLLPSGVIPPLTCEFAKVTGEYHQLAGWNDDFTGETKFERLPKNAQNYVLFIEKCVGRKIAWIGTGPEREHLIRR